MLKRLRIKFVCITMVIVTVMLCVIFGTVLHFTRKNLESQSIQMMQSIAANPLQMGRPGDLKHQVRLPYFALQIGQGGEVITMGGGYYDLSDREFLREVMEIAILSDETTGIIEQYGLRFCRVNTPAGICLVYADMSSEQSTMNHLVRVCMLIGLVSFGVLLLISLLLARWAVKPVERAWAQQRQFVGDASHELKTPLTVIMTNAELLQTDHCDDEHRDRASGAILTMSRQMRGLVEGLLELARIDGGAAQMGFSVLDFSQIVSDAVLPFEAVYFERELELTCQVEQGIRVKGSERHLKQVVDILLDNAQKYSDPCSVVRLELKKSGRGHCLLSVSGAGEELSKEELKDIFKRFYRADKVRTMSQSYGLGLPIAESIVNDHKGKIWAESGNRRNTFFVQLPCE